MLIFLVGYMASGKTTLGRRLADKLGYRFVDMDEHFEQVSSYSVPEYFDLFGEEDFRQEERELLSTLLTMQDTVIATGGGLPCFHDNMDRMNAHGTTVYLRVPASVLWRRLLGSAHDRPLLRNVSQSGLLPFITRHLEEREEYYLGAKIIAEEDMAVEDLVAAVSSRQ